MAAPMRTVIEDEEIIQYIHRNFLFLDYERHAVKLTVILTCLVFMCSLFLTSWAMFSQLKIFSNLKNKEKVFWNLAIVRAVYGASASIVGAWTIFRHSNYYRDVVFGQTATGSFALNATVGFFLFECLTLIVSDIIFRTFSRLLHVHHIFCVITAVAILLSEAGYGFVVMSLTLEMSTPFSAVCWILLKAGKARTRLWTINQIILLHTFHLRSVVEFYLWWFSYKEWTVIWTDMPWIPFITGYTTLALFTFVATPYWGYKKTIQLVNPEDWNFETNANDRFHNDHVTKVE